MVIKCFIVYWTHICLVYIMYVSSVYNIYLFIKVYKFYQNMYCSFVRVQLRGWTANRIKSFIKAIKCINFKGSVYVEH